MPPDRLVAIAQIRLARAMRRLLVLPAILWLLGLVSGYTLGNFIYILLVIALVLIVVRLVSGRRV